MQAGQRVEQGERIGAVGATGWATGPHLHFEFRVKGEHQDPLRMARAAEALTLDAGSQARVRRAWQQARGAARRSPRAWSAHESTAHKAE